LIVQPFEKSVGRANRTKSGHQYRRAIFNISDSSLRDCTRLSTTLYSLVLVSFSALINQTRQKHRTGQTSHRHCGDAEMALLRICEKTRHDARHKSSSLRLNFTPR
jgi:hypothetical protein